MRVCGQCGETGHNRRTCKKEEVPATPAPAPVRATPRGSAPAKNVAVKMAGYVLDEETQEAIDWYMEKNYPGYMERKKNRKPVESEETEE